MSSTIPSTSTPSSGIGDSASTAPATSSRLRQDASHAIIGSGTEQQAPPRSRLARLTGVQILATGGYVPPQVIRNEDLTALGCDAEWILQRTGIRERRRAADDVATSDLAYEAARDCLQQAGVRADELDLIVVGTMTPDCPMPSTACRLQRLLGSAAPAFDVNAACAGFMFALTTGMQFVASGGAKKALVVGADIMTRVMNPADRKTYPLFGDGAGAVLLGAGTRDQGFVSYTLGSEGSGEDLLKIPGGGTREPLTAESIACGRQYMQMDGRAVFKWAVRLLGDSTRDLLKHAGISANDLSLVVLHQANRRIIQAAIEELGIDPEIVVVNLDRYGNTSAGSIPLALAEAQRSGRIRPGDHLLLSGFGAGLAWGGGVFRW